MLKLTSGVCALVMAASVPFAAPAIAMPTGAPAWDQQNVMEVQYGGRGRGLERRGRDYYYNGHRGHRERRRGYRQHNGLWFAPGAFIAGAIIGGALANQQPAVQYRPRGNAHVDWCYSRYRSYRDYDNTFQPYNGPRRPCYSPYS